MHCQVTVVRMGKDWPNTALPVSSLHDSRDVYLLPVAKSCCILFCLNVNVGLEQEVSEWLSLSQGSDVSKLCLVITRHFPTINLKHKSVHRYIDIDKDRIDDVMQKQLFALLENKILRTRSSAMSLMPLSKTPCAC